MAVKFHYSKARITLTHSCLHHLRWRSMARRRIHAKMGIKSASKYKTNLSTLAGTIAFPDCLQGMPSTATILLILSANVHIDIPLG